MSNISKILFDALSRRQSIVLPGVGSLEAKRRKAKQISDTQIIPPQNVVLFTTEEVANAGSLVDIIATADGIGHEQARAEYDGWIAGARRDNGYALGEAGEIKDGSFEASAELNEALNPEGTEEVVSMEKNGNGGPLWMWILAGVLLAALILLIYFCFIAKPGDKRDKRPEAVTTSQPAPMTDSVETLPLASEAPAEKVNQKTAVSGAAGFYLITGSFEEERNADRFLAKMQKAHPGQNIEKLRNSRNGNWLVSIHRAQSEREAYNMINVLWDIEPEMWVYEVR